MFDGVTIRDADFRRATFDAFAPEGCAFEHCDFRGQTLDRRFQPLFSSRRRSVFRDCRFDEADLRAVRPGQARFERCRFDGANIDGWESFTAEFIDCTFSGRIANVRIYGRPWGAGADNLNPMRKVNEFRGNDFRKADLVSVTFVHGIDVAAQRWPQGPEYVVLDKIHQRIAKARVTVLDWREHPAREEALEMLQSAAQLYSNQMTVIGRRVEERWSAPAAVQERVWDTLARSIA
jgi:hypothetical protein